MANQVAGVGTYDNDFANGGMHSSPELCVILGVPEGSELTPEEAFALVHPDDLPDVARVFGAARDPAGDGIANLEFRLLRPDGELRWVSWSGRTLFRNTPEGRVAVRALGACLDTTERRRAERRLAAQNAVSQALATSASLTEATPAIVQAICESEDWDGGAIWKVDEHAHVLRCAELWQRPRAHGVDLHPVTCDLELAPNQDLPGRAWTSAAPLLLPDIAIDPDYPRASVALQAGLRSAYAYPIALRGQVIYVLEFLAKRIQEPPDALLRVLTAVNQQLGLFFDRKRAELQRHKLETQLRQAQKMEAIGQLSGGIAHDFNNILAAIIGNVHLARGDLTPEHPAMLSLNEIARASLRARDLVRQILLFARQQPQARKVVGLQTVVHESYDLLRASMPAGVELVLRCGVSTPHVLADATQIQQVIVNLGTNAWQALDGRPGRIEIELCEAHVDASLARTLAGVKPGSYARLTVRDNGCGIDSRMIDRIFDPFFTTKPVGQGTGLGLSVVHGIVQSHEGAIHVESVLGQGSTFEVYVPSASQQAVAQAAPDWELKRGSGQRVLYLDDENALVDVAKRMLRRLGYEVVGFTRAADAIEAFRQAPDQYALAVTDLNMPGLSGLHVAAELLRLRPDLPVVLSSGHITEDLIETAHGIGVRHVLHKPTAVEDLADVVHRFTAAASGTT